MIKERHRSLVGWRLDVHESSKGRDCDWCGEPIFKGDRYISTRHPYGGYHGECHTAMVEFWKTGEGEYVRKSMPRPEREVVL